MPRLRIGEMEELKQIQKGRCFDTKTEPQVATETSRHTKDFFKTNHLARKL